MPRPDHYLLLGDIEGSTDLSPDAYADALEHFEFAVAGVNLAFADALSVPLQVNYGDEVAGLFHDPTPMFDAVCMIRDALRGRVGFRFAASRGPIGRETPLTRKMGGPVFKAANDALTAAKRAGRFADWSVGTETENATLTYLTLLSDGYVKDFTDYQYAVYLGLRSGEKQTEIATRLGKFPQSVSDSIQRSRADLVVETEAHLRRLLSGLPKLQIIDTAESMKND